MSLRKHSTLLAVAVGVAIASAASAQERPRIVIVPTQHFNADAQSAANVTDALVRQFEQQGYRVIPLERTRKTFQEMGLDRRRDIGDPVLIPFGRLIGADLVAHPQLLAAGLPAAARARASMQRPGAVLYLRVLNVRTAKPIYTRQIRHEFEGTVETDGTASVPPAAAMAAATAVSRPYFERVAGSRQEIGRPAR
jgi:hypothetical protein